MNNNAYVFGQRKAGAKENVLSQERLEQIKQNVNSLKYSSIKLPFPHVCSSMMAWQNGHSFFNVRTDSPHLEQT